MLARTMIRVVVGVALACASPADVIETTSGGTSVGTPAAGISTATVELDADTDLALTTLTFDGDVSGLSGTLLDFHIHEGSFLSAPVLTLAKSATGAGSWHVSGTLDLSTGTTLESLASAGLFFDAHTSAYPGSEVRGRIELSSHAYARRDAGVLGVTIFGGFLYMPGASTFGYDVEVDGLPPLPSEAPAVAKVHVGSAITGGGPALFTLTATGINDWQGTSPVLALPDRIAYLSAGLYVEVTQNGQMAVRGQIRPGFLNRSLANLSVVTGGEQILLMNSGATGAGKLHFVVGSVTGASPPLVLGPHVALPLVPDAYFSLLASAPNTVVAGSFGLLDGLGKAEAVFQLPPGLNLPVPMTVWHAYVGIDVASPSLFAFASNAVTLTIVP